MEGLIRMELKKTIDAKFDALFIFMGGETLPLFNLFCFLKANHFFYFPDPQIFSPDVWARACAFNR